MNNRISYWIGGLGMLVAGGLFVQSSATGISRGRALAAARPNAAAAVPVEVAAPVAPAAASGPVAPPAAVPPAGLTEGPAPAAGAVDAPAVPPPDYAQEWQRELSADLDHMQEHGQVVLEGGFKLYDMLLREEPLTAEDQRNFDTYLQSAAAAYSKLAEGLRQLERHLGAAKPDGRWVQRLQDIKARANTYPEPAKGPVQYVPTDAAAGPGIVNVLLGRSAADNGALGELPRTKRDAFQLLDILTKMTEDLAAISEQTTGWLHHRS